MSTTPDATHAAVGNILIVDDYPMNRLKLSRILERQGHKIAMAGNGVEALAQMRATPFDVVLLDIVMPEMDGYQVLERVNADPDLRDTPVIVISAIDEIDSVVRCIEMGAVDYLPKPYNPTILNARVQTSLQRKRLRDLERSYLQQEIMLRQSEKLATLGKLSAGMAHELNNPVAAILRGAHHLSRAIEHQLTAHFSLDRAGLSATQIDQLKRLDRDAQTAAATPGELDALTRSDREAQIEAWLEDAGVDAAWELASDLVNLSFDPDRLGELAAQFDDTRQFARVLTWLVSRYTTASVLREIGEGSARVAEIVKALKTFTYLDQAPVQNVNIHEGLDNTLIILRNKLKQGVSVERAYAADLPLIEARGTELNQVWTNIIDNAIHAMDGQGTLTLRTRWEDPWVVVEIEDSGPGIPEAVRTTIFDPFVTTKAPGEGTGLGLNISHNIIVQKHGGSIAVESRPGRTCFQIRLPLSPGGEAA